MCYKSYNHDKKKQSFLFQSQADFEMTTGWGRQNEVEPIKAE